MSVIRKSVLVLTKPLAVVSAMLSGLLLTNKGKRIIFAASLYTHLNRIDPNSMDQDKMMDYLNEINRLFQLTDREVRALMMPLLLHDFIWRGIDLPDDKTLTKQTVQTSCELLLRQIPRWLRYDRKVMRDDASIIVRSVVGRNLLLSAP